MFDSLPKQLNICCVYVKRNFSMRRFLSSTKIMLKLMDTRIYTVNITLNPFS